MSKETPLYTQLLASTMSNPTLACGIRTLEEQEATPASTIAMGLVAHALNSCNYLTEEFIPVEVTRSRRALFASMFAHHSDEIPKYLYVGEDQRFHLIPETASEMLDNPKTSKFAYMVGMKVSPHTSEKYNLKSSTSSELDQRPISTQSQAESPVLTDKATFFEDIYAQPMPDISSIRGNKYRYTSPYRQIRPEYFGLFEGLHEFWDGLRGGSSSGHDQGGCYVTQSNVSFGDRVRDAESIQTLRTLAGRANTHIKNKTLSFKQALFRLKRTAPQAA